MILASADFGLSYLLEIVALIMVFLVIKRYIAPYMSKMMNQKLEQIKTQLAAGEQARADAEALVADRRAQVEVARSEATAIVEQARRAAQTARTDGEQRATQEYERLVARAHTELVLQTQRVGAEVAAEMGAVILEGTTRLVHAELNGTRHRSLIDTAIIAAESETLA